MSKVVGQTITLNKAPLWEILLYEMEHYMPKLELQINVRLLRRSMHSLTRGRHDIETTTNSPLLFNRFYPSRF